MPTMPFHHEKGDVLNALESLMNEPANQTALKSAVDGLLTGGNMKTTLDNTAAATGDVDFQNLMQIATAGWLGTSGYWIDYEGDVDCIVKKALLFSMRRAWNWRGGIDKFPPAHRRKRKVRLWWHCSQRWFEAWVTWEDTKGPINVLFATPPHVGGTVWPDMILAENHGDADPLTGPFQADPHGDMVLISQPHHLPKFDPLTTIEELNTIQIPKISTAYEDSGTVGKWSIPAHAGGMNKRKVWP